jgi:hypothetical protein
MYEATLIGIDLAKLVFQLHGAQSNIYYCKF